MEPPKNTRIIDLPSSFYWFDEHNILCSVQKKVPTPTLEEVKQTLEAFKKEINGKKICFLIDTTYSSETSKEIRDYASLEFVKFTKAMAIISTSPLGRMLANIFFRLKKQPFPSKIFNNEIKAKEWLKQYL